MTFMDDHFMLISPAAEKIYDSIKDLPIYDYHCHLDPKEIYEDKPFDNIVDLWLGGDHYKWRLMRANGVPEEQITGDASNKEKFKVWAETVGRAFGNPLFHFSHLELKNIFGIEEHLNETNWQEMYERLNSIIKEKKLSPRKLILSSNVDFIGTTDSPLDDLKWHEKIAQDDTISTTVSPTFRPDAAFVHHVDFKQFVQDLGDLESVEISNYSEFVDGLELRIKYFAERGCKASDLSLDAITYQSATEDELNSILNKRLSDQKLTMEEITKWQTELLKSLCYLYKKYDFVTQIHFGAQRNNSTIYYKQVGADSGFDSIGDQTSLAQGMSLLIDSLQQENKLPKMIWYNLNPTYNTVVANTIANFQANNENQRNLLQFGSAWWFADHKRGMLDQMQTLAEQGMLANFVGMLTDSRSFLSYSRHDYFRRLLASLLGEWIDKGEIPEDYDFVGQFAQDIAFYNAKNFFEK
ncbi:glucuronate isomerase [Dolosicoccus paucivorans]|uniref:Uronate isomerase n=1 Tax=Dolosicoccus paucivorans TaxID=84521 RepID=A0A2N6SLG5_9LACT|nr:glucuronate isomerase [Dolosicoccus paucivorans]PMC57905.1 glucuronate isomerase [Dolosicoccus paucivorans]